MGTLKIIHPNPPYIELESGIKKFNIDSTISSMYRRMVKEGRFNEKL